MPINARYTTYAPAPQPGPEISASYQFSIDDIQWMAGSEWRANAPEGCPPEIVENRTHCLHGLNESVTVNLLNFSDMFGSRTNLIDLKLGKNIRFARRRVNVGVDVYNLFNTDAALSYNGTYNPQEWEDEHGNLYVGNSWRSVTQLQAPRSARVSVQFNF